MLRFKGKDYALTKLLAPSTYPSLQKCSYCSIIILISITVFFLYQLNRVKAVEKEKDELEGTKDEAVEYINMENSITKKRNTLFQKYM